MKLRRIQLVGFKSFKDRVTIELGDDMNGIVGPNGCGKSNVVDALKWAMGDMSAKSLRGAALSDVIFAGSQNHRAAGMAEVTLTFENEARPPASPGTAEHSGMLNDEVAAPEAAAAAEQPLEGASPAGDVAEPDGAVWDDAIPREYREMAEISITRRLHRSGESEYLINKTPCRLMDIQNLLAGTGLGKQGYSVIEQGEISFVVSAKPHERRLIIEEASGITRYKSQRDRSQRKLDRALENLQRVDDVVAEVDKQLRSLERQARRAERFKKLSDELRILEIAHIVDRRNALSEKAAGLRKSLESGRSGAEKAQASLKKLEGELSSQKVEAFVAEKKSAEATEHFYKLDTRLNLAKSNRKHLQDALEEAKSRHARALSEHAEQSRRRTGLKAELARVTADLEALDETPEDAQTRIEGIERALGELKDTFQQAEAARDQARTELEQARAEIRRVRDRREWLVGQKDELERRRAQIGDEIAAAGRDVEDLRRALNRLQMDQERTEEALRDARSQAQDAEKTRVLAREALSRAREELDELRAERVEVTARVKTLSEMRRRGEGYTRGVQRVLEWARDSRADILAPVGDLLEVPEGTEAAASAFIGEAFNDIVVTDRQAAMDALAMLDEEKIGRAGFYVLRAPVDQAGAELKELLEGLQIVDSLANRALETGADTSEIRAWATQKGDIEFSNGRIIGGHLGNQAESVLRQARELKALQERLAQVEDWELDAQEEFDAAQDKAQLSEERVANARQAVDQYELETRRLEQEMLGEERESERAEKRLRRIRAEEQPLEERLEKIAQDAAELDGSGEQLAAQLPQMEQAVHTRAQTCQTLRAEVEERQKTLTQHKIDLAQARERRRNLAESVERLTRSLESNQTQLLRLEREASEQQTRLREFEDNSGTTSTEVEQLEATFSQAKQAADAAREHLDQVQNEVRRLELAILERRREVEQQAGGVQQVEMALREVGIEIEHVDRNLAERFEMGFFEATQLAQAHADSDAESAKLDPAAREQRIKTLRRDIDKMGPVNAMAVHEFEEARERRAFLENQQFDLQVAIEDLNKAIRRMDRESRKRFEQTFEAVNARFQQFFPRLFRGGHARLMLTDPDNILESGVDIEVSPPGKRLQNVTLLSGGEKALTAVSLIFAIFSLKPTPFSVLDEVDAPLDEANVGRYAQMVRELSKQSQMIVITHNRRSMEVCDTLYGVTMEEPGVSKVVSVRLHELDTIDGRQAS